MERILLTGADAYIMLAIWSVGCAYIGWKFGNSETRVWKAKYEAHIKTFYGFMSKFPIVELNVVEAKKPTNENATDDQPVNPKVRAKEGFGK